VRQALGKHFIQTGLIPKESGRFFTALYNKMQTSDYDDFIDFNLEVVEELKSSAGEFISEIDKVINS